MTKRASRSSSTATTGTSGNATSKRTSAASQRSSRNRTSAPILSGDGRRSWTSSSSSNRTWKTRISRSTVHSSSLSLHKSKPRRRHRFGRRNKHRHQWWCRRERVVAVGDLGKPGLFSRLVCKLRNKRRT